MIAWIRSFFAEYEFAAIGIAMLIMLGVGWQAHTIWDGYKAEKQARAEVAARDKIIDDLENEVKVQSDIGKETARKNAALAEQNNNLKNQIEKSYDQVPAITSACLAPVRVQLLNQQRAAANSIRAR